MTERKTDPIAAFEHERTTTIATYAGDGELKDSSARWLDLAFRRRYMYHFDWLGRPIIQLPGDIVAFQEMVWAVKPDLIIETGIAHGGSLILSASLLAMLDMADAIENEKPFDPKDTRRRVLGIDIDIRTHNRTAIEAHPFAHRIDMIEGSSIDPAMGGDVAQRAAGYERVMVCLDSNHTHEHVLAELEIYAPLTSLGSYCLVFDTIVEDLPDDTFPDRHWGKGNSPKSAIWEYQRILDEDGRQAADGDQLRLELDRTVDEKLLLSAAPHGFLRRV